MLLEKLLERAAVKIFVFGDHLNHAGEIGEQVPLISICKNGGNSGVVKLNIFVMHLDKVNGWVCAHEWEERRLDSS